MPSSILRATRAANWKALRNAFRRGNYDWQQAAMKRPLPARPGRPVRGSTTGRPVMALLDLLGRRWALRGLWGLRDGPVKFRELAQRADAMSQSVLSRRLNELETACFVTSDEDGWQLTDNGSELLQVFSPLSRFATRWAKLINQSDDESAS